MFLLLDNYDSFTYNVLHLLARHLGDKNITVARNDELSVKEAMKIGNDGIIISPGPCTPKEAGIAIKLIQQCAIEKKPLFGICLGLQAMVEAFGGKVAPYQPPRHGKVSTIICDQDHWLFKGLPKQWNATRYHSLAVTKMPPDLITIATSHDDNQVMAVAHKNLPMAAVQFHPESHYGKMGDDIIKNFLSFVLAKDMAISKKGEQKTMDIVISQLLAGNDVAPNLIKECFDRMMKGEELVDTMVAFLKALETKGVNANDLTAAAEVMRAHAEKITAPKNAMDIVGTGGDLKGTFNVSTASSFVVAGAGIPIAKHGNRAITSQSGTADVQQSLGINIDYPLPRVQAGMDKLGFAFFFAPKHHAATRHVMPARKILAEQKIKTIFNLLGPLTNPAEVQFYLIGVYDKKWLQPMAMALKNMGAKKAWLVHGDEGLDEVSISGATHVVMLVDGNISQSTITPDMAGLKTHPLSAIKGGTADHNAAAILSLLSQPSIADHHNLAGFRDAVLLNSSVALHIVGVAKNLKDGVAMARESITSGKALKKLKAFAEFTKQGK